MSSSSELFEAEATFKRIESGVFHDLMLACGIDPRNPDSWPHEDITHDYYDNSFEFIGVADSDWQPTQKGFAMCWAMGFSRCWICYKDGSERRFYSPLLQRVFPGEPEGAPLSPRTPE